jgi:integrase
MPRQSLPWYWKQRDAWCVQLDGKRVVLAHGKANRQQAHRELHRRLVAGGKAAAGESPVSDLLELFLRHVAGQVERGERAQITYDRYADFLSAAAESFGHVKADALKPHHVESWAEAPAAGWGATTRFNAITAVKAAFRWASRRGYISGSPLADMVKPTPKRRTAVLTDEQVRVILAAADPAWRDLVTALWLTGCRPTEVTTLKADRVDLDRGVWNVANKTRTSTGQQTRPVPLVPEMVEMSRRLVEKRPEGPIFRNRNGKAWKRNAMACRFRRLREVHGWGDECSAYALRHRYAIEALRRGLDPSELAALMGHTSTKLILSTYGHWDSQVDRLREAARRVRPGAQG